MAGKRGAGEGTFWKKSNGRWYGKRRIGVREAVVTINASGATLAEAKANQRAKVEQHLHAGHAPIDSTATLALYLQWWVDEELAERVADGTIVSTTRQQYANKVKHQILPLLGHVPLRELSVMQLRQWLAALARQGASPNTRRHALAVLKTALERAVRYELLPGNPARLVDPPRVHRERRAEITLDTARALLQAAKGDSLEAAYVVALHIPLRVGEVVGAEWSCFDFEQRLFTVRQNLVRLEGRWELHGTKPAWYRSPTPRWQCYGRTAPAKLSSVWPRVRRGGHPRSSTSRSEPGAGRTSFSPARPAARTSIRASTSDSARSALAQTYRRWPPTTSAAPPTPCSASPASTPPSSANSPATTLSR